MNSTSYRKLLVPLTGGAHEIAAIDGAMKAAKRFNAHVVGLFVQPDPFDEIAHAGIDSAGLLIGDMIERADRDAKSVKTKTHTEFVAAAQSAGVALTAPRCDGEIPTAEFARLRGNIMQGIEEESRLSDLVVFCSSKDTDKSKTREMVDTVLLRGCAPVLYFPYQCSRDVGAQIAVGYDGSAAGAHSLRAALPFLARAEKLHLMGLPGTSGEADKHLQQLKTYLSIRGVSACADGVSHGPNDRARQIIDSAQAKGCNLLVIGGYAQKTMREWFLGGAADQFFDANPSMALLMAH